MHLTLPGKQHATNETATKDVYEPWNRIQPMREPEATQTQTLTSRLQNQISFLCYSLMLHQFIATLSFVKFNGLVLSKTLTYQLPEPLTQAIDSPGVQSPSQAKLTQQTLA